MGDRFGLLYDACFCHDLPTGGSELDFLEIIPDRFSAVSDPSRIPDSLAAFPSVFHCLNFSLGSDEELDGDYLASIARLARRFRPQWASDHLAVTRVDRVELGHLSPIRMTNAAVDRIAGKIVAIQDTLKIPFLVENIAHYFRIPGSEVSERELLAALVERTGCGLLLDLNNLVVNAANFGFDARAYLEGFPLGAVAEIHVAGHRKHGAMHIDSHGDPVAESVWDLLRFVSCRLKSVSVVLERDQDIPPFRDLLRELGVARSGVAEGRRQGSPIGARA